MVVRLDVGCCRLYEGISEENSLRIEVHAGQPIGRLGLKARANITDADLFPLHSTVAPFRQLSKTIIAFGVAKDNISLSSTHEDTVGNYKMASLRCPGLLRQVAARRTIQFPIKRLESSMTPATAPSLRTTDQNQPIYGVEEDKATSYVQRL